MMNTPEINQHTVDLASNTSDTNYPYPSKSGPVLNVFLCYFRSTGHNIKPRTSTFGGVSSFTCSFTVCVLVCRHLQMQYTPLRAFTGKRGLSVCNRTTEDIRCAVSRQTENVM